jgi:hypothetical protein
MSGVVAGSRQRPRCPSCFYRSANHQRERLAESVYGSLDKYGCRSRRFGEWEPAIGIVKYVSVNLFDLV